MVDVEMKISFKLSGEVGGRNSYGVVEKAVYDAIHNRLWRRIQDLKVEMVVFGPLQEEPVAEEVQEKGEPNNT